MRLISLFIFLISISTTCLAQEGSLFIIGGGSRPPAMVDFMINKSGLRPTDPIYILPWSSSEPDSSAYYAKMQFQEQGHEKFTVILPEELDGLNAKDFKALRKAKLIYIPGGDQRRFMEYAITHNFGQHLESAFQSGAMIAGTSAGAAIMSDKMITGTALKYEEYHPTFRTLEKDNIELAQGMGLLPHNIIIDQHFIWRSRYNRLLTAIIEYPELTGWGIEESTAAYVKDGKVEVVGKYQLIKFTNISKKQKQKDGLLGEEQIMLSIFLPGDIFDLN